MAISLLQFFLALGVYSAHSAPSNLRGASGVTEIPTQLLESSRRKAPATQTSMAKQLFSEHTGGPIGASSTTFRCGEVGSGTLELYGR